jgi:hypothetical protein
MLHKDPQPLCDLHIKRGGRKQGAERNCELSSARLGSKCNSDTETTIKPIQHISLLILPYAAVVAAVTGGQSSSEHLSPGRASTAI